MDKNKSTYKLNGIGPIYYLNLDGQPERRQYMEDQFKYWGIENYTRISAYDGREDDLSDIIKGRYPEMMSSGEIGCVTSHLKAIKHWYETSDSPYAVIMEDDCNLDLVKFWNFTWNDFYCRIPYDWDVMQIAIICTGDVHVKVHKRFVNEFSTACYLITRHHAEKSTPTKEIHISSLRPGEKMSEALLNENEIRRTIEQDNYYIIKPDYALQHIKHNFIHLKSYDSADSEICLSKDELKQYLQNKDFL